VTIKGNLQRAVDASIEETILLSWSRIGIALRRRMWSWDNGIDSSFSGKVAIVTGGTSGIGRASAIALAQAGAAVGIVGRDPRRTADAARLISESSPIGSAWPEVADMGSIEQTESLARRISERTDRVDVLVHCAGTLEKRYRNSADGIETTAAVHVVGPHLLTSRLERLLCHSSPSVVVWVSSGGMYSQRLDVDRLDADSEHYRATVAYAQSKRAQVVLASLWNDRLKSTGVASLAMHPGWVNSKALSEGLPRFAKAMRPVLRSPAEGADTIVWLADGSAGRWAESGIWLDRRVRKTQRWPIRGQRPDEPMRLWQWCETKTGLRSTSGAEA